MKVDKSQFQRLLNNRKFLIIVHRGSHGGNIIENTSEAVKVAKLQHADIAEIDIVQSTDGKFFVFHDGREKRLLNEQRNLKELSSQEIMNKSYYNSIGERIGKKVESFDDFYQRIDHKTFLNIDRSWFYWEKFLPYLDQFQSMHEYFLLKSPPKREFLEVLNHHHINYLYFPIINKEEQLSILEDYPNLNIVGLELLSNSVDFELLRSPKLEKYQNGEYMLLANSIKLNDWVDLFGGLDDNEALLESASSSWGKILNLNINAIQTDWPDILDEYRKNLL